MRVPIELVTGTDVARFTEIVQQVDSDVRLVGKDEHGHHWEMSAKSLLWSLVVAAKFQVDRQSHAHNVNWNTVWCECDEDIYHLIQQFVKGGT